MACVSPHLPPARRRRALVTALVLLVAGPGCVRNEDRTATLTFGFWGSTEQARTEAAVARAFEAANPGVRIETMAIAGNSSRYNDKVQAMLVGQVAPDVIMIESARYDEWASRGVLAEIGADVGAIDAATPLMPVARQAFERGGRFYAAPINAHAFATYYNRNALAAAGVSLDVARLEWEELLAIAPRLSKAAGGASATTDYALQMPLPIILFWAFGGTLFDDPHTPRRALVNTREGRDAISFMRRLLASGAVLPPDIGAMAADHGTFQLFRDGRIAFYFSGRWNTPDFLRIRDFEWDVAPIPAGPAGAISLHGGTALGVWTGARNQELARRFVRFYASETGARIAMQTKRLVPVHRTLAYSDDFLSLTPPASLAVFARGMEAGAARSYLYAPGFGVAKRIFDEAMERALLSPHLPAEAVLADLERDLNRWLEQRAARLP